MMTGQHAIICSESLSVQQLVTLYKLTYHEMMNMLAGWIQRTLPILNLIKRKNLTSTTTLVVIVTRFEQPDSDQRK